MTATFLNAAMMIALLGGLSACVQATGKQVQTASVGVKYLGIETRLLDGDLVNFHVSMSGANSPADVSDYAKCAAAQYSLIRGFGFARHVRTNVEEDGGIWRGDAVYTVSAALPDGRLTLDAEVVVDNCKDDGIPTI